MPQLKQLPNLDIYTYSQELRNVLQTRINNDCINQIFEYMTNTIKMKEKQQTICCLFDYYEDVKGNYYPEADVIKHFSLKELKEVVKFQGGRTTSKTLRDYLKKYDYNSRVSTKIYKEHLALHIIGSFDNLLSCVRD